MSNFIKNIFENTTQVSISKIIAALLGIVMVRTFLENFSSPPKSGYFFPWTEAYLNFPLYYFSVFLLFSLILHFITKKSLNQIFAFMVKIFIFIWMAPIVDLLFSNGQGKLMSYILTGPQNFASAFFDMINPFGFHGVTPGVHVAAYLILLAMGIFIYKATANLRKAFSGILIAYMCLFLYAMSFSIIAMPKQLSANLNSATDAYNLTIKESWLVTTAQKETLMNFKLFDLEELYAAPITQVFYLLLAVEIAIVFRMLYRETFSAIKKHLRMERILFWSAIAIVGMAIGQKMFGPINFLNTVNLISLTVFFVLICIGAWLATCFNDAEDLAIDAISNPSRPLVQKTIRPDVWNKLTALLAVMLLFGLATLNAIVAFMLIFSQAAYYIYSASPLRLKKNFISSSIVIGVVSVAMSMAGFFLVSPQQQLKAFPISSIWLLGIVFALISNFKDIKDFEGDKSESIKTIPVVFGLKKAKIIIALLFGLVFIAIPILLNLNFLLTLVSVFAAVFAYRLFLAREYKERNIFYLLFAYMVIIGFSYF